MYLEECYIHKHMCITSGVAHVCMCSCTYMYINIYEDINTIPTELGPGDTRCTVTEQHVYVQTAVLDTSRAVQKAV